MDISRRPPGSLQIRPCPRRLVAEGTRPSSISTVEWINSLRNFISFSLCSQSAPEAAAKIAAIRPPFYGKLVVGFQSQDTSGCLSPSVTGQAFSSIVGSAKAAHPGSSLRQSPSFVGEGHTQTRGRPRFYKNNTTAPCLCSLIQTRFPRFFRLRRRIFFPYIFPPPRS